MFMKYLILAVVQFFLFVFALPLVVGVLAGMFGREKAARRVWHIAGGLLVLIEIAVMIDKGGVPFLTGHIVNMFLYTPVSLPLQLLIGLAGDSLLLLSFRRSVAQGVAAGLRVVSPNTAS